MQADQSESHVSNLQQRGYTLLEGQFSAEAVAFMRARCEAIYETVKDGVPYADNPIEMRPHVYKTNMGLNIRGIGHFDPELVERMIDADVVEVLRGVFGGVRFEMSSIMFANESRPFVRWHNHVAGFSETDGHTPRGWPTFEELERITMIGYLNDLTPETGELLLYPRAVTDTTAPPYDQRREEWPGQVVVRCPRGTVALVDQATWHAVRRQRGTGMRILIGGLFAATRTPIPEWYDRSLLAAASPQSLLRSLVPSEIS